MDEKPKEKAAYASSANNQVVQLSFQAPTTCFAGQAVHGALHLRANRDVRASSLEFSFLGQEQVSAVMGNYSRKQEKGELIHFDFAARHVNLILQRNGNILPRGNYRIPFSFHLPSNLPSTTKMFRGDCIARVEYHLEATLRKASSSRHGQDIQSRQLVRIHAHPDNELVPFTSAPASHCVPVGRHKGTVFVGAHADKTHLGRGQGMALNLAVLNQSMADISAIQVKLQQRATWISNGKTVSQTANLIQQSCRTTQFPGIRSTPTNKIQDVSKVAHPNRNKVIQEQLALGSGTNLTTIRLPAIPKGTKDSYAGQHSSISHEVVVVLKTNRWGHKKNPEIRIPVVVHPGIISM